MTTRKTSNIGHRLQNQRMILISFCLFIILHGFTGAITEGQASTYEPEDNIAIGCGSRGGDQNKRHWDGDIDSKVFSLEEGQNKESTDSEVAGQFTQGDDLPYRTARLSRFEFTYIVPVSQPGPKFVRLHFYSSPYKAENENYDISKAYFSVKIGQYTLLSNFSVSLTADYLGQNSLVKEFCVTVEKSRLNITFTPSSSVPGAFALINGIEVVSIPNNLYYPESEDDVAYKFVTQTSSYNFRNTTALATMYRVNIGGGAISPEKDSGLYRYWEQQGDDYLTVTGSSVLPILHDESKIHYTGKVPAYTAPKPVYTTGRSTGRGDVATVTGYKLTWEFPLHSGFNYLVRLHFCEIEKEVNKTGDRVFSIFIADDLVDSKADIIYYSGGKYTPYVQNYIASVYGKSNLSVALQAIADSSISFYADAILNGIEIFKLSDSAGNLAGPNLPQRVTPISPSLTQQRGKGKNSSTAIIGIVAGVSSGTILLLILIFFLLRRARKVKDSTSSDGTTWWGPFSFTTIKSSKTRGSSSLPSDLCRYFSLAEIKAATNNFEDIFIIGMGGFGNVYKGYIDNGTNPVAIKRLKSESSQGAHEFKTEIEMLSHLRHRHLVSLIGYCNEDREMILVYDYMARGTLRGHLYNSENPPLAWKQRLEICIGAARGLHYLHTGAKYKIIHRDVKTTNILLDEKWVAKVSDFGLSKMGPTTMSKGYVSTVVKGSIGYLDPEYYRRQQLSEKSDVYSFGVVLCEVLCGRPPIIRNAEKRQVSLAEWARNCYRDGTLHQIIDPNLRGKIAPECLKKYSDIAVNCMHDNGTERPSMNDVVWGLEFALQLQQNAEDNDRTGGTIMEVKGEDEVAFLNNNNSDGTFTCSWEESLELKSSGMTKISSSEEGSTTSKSMKGMSGAVFSEIKDPKGR